MDVVLSTIPNHINSQYCKRKIKAKQTCILGSALRPRRASNISMLPLSHVQWRRVIPWERSSVPSKNYKYWHLYNIVLRQLMVILLLYTICDIFLHFRPVCWRLFWWSLDSAVDALYLHPCTNQRLSYFCPQSLCLYWTLCWHLPTHHQPVSCQTASYKKKIN